MNGIVCSFCAQGVEKALGKLDGLDKSKYGNGIHVDIYHQRVIIAFLEGAEVPQEEIRNRIRGAGYDPVAIHLGPGL